MKSNAYFEHFSFHFLLILRMAEFHLYLFSRVFETSQLSFAPRAIACHILKTHEISYSGGIYLKLFAQKHFLLLPFSCTTSTTRTWTYICFWLWKNNNIFSFTSIFVLDGKNMTFSPCCFFFHKMSAFCIFWSNRVFTTIYDNHVVFKGERWELLLLLT